MFYVHVQGIKVTWIMSFYRLEIPLGHTLSVQLRLNLLHRFIFTSVNSNATALGAKFMTNYQSLALAFNKTCLFCEWALYVLYCFKQFNYKCIL